MNQQYNQISEQDINTRKELWDNLFLVVDFSRMKEEYPNMWNKEYRMLPLANTYSEIKKKFSEYCAGLNQKVENLIESYREFFQANIYPLLNKPEGDKTLLFRCKRLLDNKVIGETSSLFLDLVIWEVEYRQVEKFKGALRILGTNPMFLADREDELFMSDCEKMIEGRINYLLGQRFYLKWSQLVAKSGVQKEAWAEIGEYLRKWQAGKGTSSEWATDLKIMEQARDNLLNTPAEQPYFFSLGVIKEQTEQGIVLATQNMKGVDLNNPYLMLFWFHQKPNGVKPLNYRGYFVEKFKVVDTKRLYVELKLREDWVWRNYGRGLSSMGALSSGEHPVYRG